jgi:hypothetical protein
MPGHFIDKSKWDDVKPPFSFVRVDNPEFRDTHREMMKKWLVARCGGWIYFDDVDTFVFERPGDAMMFRIWVESEPFQSDGSIDDPA